MFDTVHCSFNTLYVCITVLTFKMYLFKKNLNLHETRAKSGLQDRLLHPVSQQVTYTKHWQVAMSKRLLVTMPLVARHWSCILLVKSTNHQAFPWTSLCQRYPKLPRETVATKQQRPASQLPILQYSLLHMCNCQSMALTGSKFVITHPCLCNIQFTCTCTEPEIYSTGV